jgi:hypothetical protein
MPDGVDLLFIITSPEEDTTTISDLAQVLLLDTKITDE